MKLFTKSAFKIAMHCPRQLYYYFASGEYANQAAGDEFLQSLAEGGFQVGELAKMYCDVPAENDLDSLRGNEAQLAKTEELVSLDQVNIAEAAFRHRNLFVRADVIKKAGNDVELIEVKAKSWESGKPFLKKSRRDGAEGIDSEIVEYIYDVAYQKYVISLVHPEWKIRASLMLADKATKAGVDGMNQCFRIVRDGSGQTKVEVSTDAACLCGCGHVLTQFDVDDICNRIIDGTIAGQTELLHGMDFKTFVGEMSRMYCNHENRFVELSKECFKCPFCVKDGDSGHLKDGFKECWTEKARLQEADFNKPLIRDLWAGSGSKTRNRLLGEGKYRLEDVSESDFHEKEGVLSSGDSRRAIQIALSTGRLNMVPPGLWRYVTKEGFYFDFERVAAEMGKWKFPLHMIDFETTSVALPFYKGMSPYETVAFQFSHHRIDELADGGFKITHAGQYINTKRGAFPNFEFARELKKNLENDEGSVFRYSNHENTVLNTIREQLLASDESDKEELVSFIDSITHRDEFDADGNKVKISGSRDMVDLCELVKECFYSPLMKGSNSIKAVLPAILNISKELQDRYSKPIYGGDGEITSINIKPGEKPMSLVEKECDSDGNTVVASPYRTLPAIGAYLPSGRDGWQGDQSCGGISEVNNGGGALSAYGVLQFYDEDDVRAKALEKALLRYCELDTMAMVFIWEFFDLMTKRATAEFFGMVNQKHIFRLGPKDWDAFTKS